MISHDPVLTTQTGHGVTFSQYNYLEYSDETDGYSDYYRQAG